ncbi:DUF3047 domain-containing protein [Limnobacter humi]|uniref:DUF3047 domain-containing protein n=1 Tax=Limnobacter humi TaxID=1778671 RepID=A0ABT1WH70_9BURK|nr:DUF3047 domain-containing protein [Limnobacter humi]
MNTIKKSQGPIAVLLGILLQAGAVMATRDVGLVQAQTVSPSAANVPVIPAWPKQPGALPAPWKTQFHPKVPKHTDFKLISFEGQTVVQAKSESGYGSVALAFDKPSEFNTLQWSWLVQQHPKNANPKTKDGDDAGAKLCVFVQIDESTLSFGTRLKLGAARTLSGEDLPAATLCYMWAAEGTPTGEVFNNPYTDRVRNMVIRASAEGTALVNEQRNVQQDARRAFAKELPEGPVKFLGIAFGADADNTQSTALGLFGSVSVK